MALSLTLLLSTPVAFASEATASVGVYASAAWQVPVKGGGVDIYWVWVFRGPTERGLETIAYAGKARCRSRSWDDFYFFCIDAHGLRELQPLRSATFEHDPAMGAAVLNFTARGGRHEVRWQAREGFGSIDHSALEMGGAHNTRTRYSRRMSASGEIFGARFGSGSMLRKQSALFYEAVTRLKP